MSGNAERCAQSRKSLAEQLKNAKKASPDDKNRLMGMLIKRFQKEVDELTRRSTYAESSFASLYKRLYELPDPVKSISFAIGQEELVAEKNAKLQGLQEQLEEYDAEFKQMKNQEVYVRELELKVRELESQLSEKSDSASDQLLQQWQLERSELIQDFKSREQQTNSELQSTRDKLLKTQLAHDKVQARLLKISDSTYQDEATRDSEAMMLFEELEQTNSTIASLRLENSELRGRVQALQPQLQPSPHRASQVSEGDLRASEQRVQNLQDRLSSSLASHESEVSALTSDLKEERERLHEQMQLNQELKQHIETLPVPEEYERLRRKLHLIQAVQFNALDIDAEDGDEEGQLKFEESELEVRLLKKNRSLESEVTTLRRELLELGQQLAEFEQRHDELLQKSQANEALVAELEQSVEMYSSKQVPNNEKLSFLLDSNADQVALSIPTGGSEVEATAAADPSPFDIVVGQRDRYRKRVQALEAEQVDDRNKVGELLKKVAALEKDNVKLYEKMQYVQSYRRQNADARLRDLEEGGNATVEKYRKIYEDTTNPFTAFNRKQKQTRYHNLNAFDKVTLNTAQTVLSSKRLRALLVFYMIALHLLVFITLVTHTVTSHCHTGTARAI